MRKRTRAWLEALLAAAISGFAAGFPAGFAAMVLDPALGFEGAIKVAVAGAAGSAISGVFALLRRSPLPGVTVDGVAPPPGGS